VIGLELRWGIDVEKQRRKRQGIDVALIWMHFWQRGIELGERMKSEKLGFLQFRHIVLGG